MKTLLVMCIEFTRHRCGLLDTALRPPGGTVEVVREFGRQGCKVDWIEKACPQVDHDDGNQKKAKEIIEKVRGAVENARLVGAWPARPGPAPALFLRPGWPDDGKSARKGTVMAGTIAPAGLESPRRAGM
jgi:hypothetical protein